VRFKFRNLLIAAVLYIWVLSVILGFSYAIFGGVRLLVVAILYAVGCMYGAKLMIDGALARISQGSVVEFSKSSATAALGEAWKSFHYLFESDEDLTQPLIARLSTDLQKKLGCSELKETTFRDIDRDLSQPEFRSFRLTLAPESVRRTRFHFLCAVSRTVNVQGLRWWVLVLGLRDPNKAFWRYALAPVTVPFVTLAYFRREFEPLHGLMSVDPGFFNSIDTLTRTREIEFVAYNALIDTLESFGIDTADLRLQRANILNVNVGDHGSVSIGSLIQGAFNRVTGGGNGGGGKA
jgi:hypothetical protein